MGYDDDRAKNAALESRHLQQMRERLTVMGKELFKQAIPNLDASLLLGAYKTQEFIVPDFEFTTVEDVLIWNANQYAGQLGKFIFWHKKRPVDDDSVDLNRNELRVPQAIVTAVMMHADTYFAFAEDCDPQDKFMTDAELAQLLSLLDQNREE